MGSCLLREGSVDYLNGQRADYSRRHSGIESTRAPRIPASRGGGAFFLLLYYFRSIPNVYTAWNGRYNRVSQSVHTNTDHLQFSEVSMHISLH